MRRFSGRLDVALLTQPHAGPATARNTAAARARGEVLAFTDDDCAPASDWLTHLALRFAQDKHVAVGGKTINALTNDPYAAASQLIMDVVYAYYNGDGSRARFIASNNVAFQKTAFTRSAGLTRRFPWLRKTAIYATGGCTTASASSTLRKSSSVTHIGWGCAGTPASISIMAAAHTCSSEHAWAVAREIS